MTRISAQVTDGPNGNKVYSTLGAGPLLSVLTHVFADLTRMNVLHRRIESINAEHAMADIDGTPRWSIVVEFRP